MNYSEGPGTIIWAMYCYGLFLDEYNEPKLAFSIVDEALAMAPTCIDFIMLRARIYKVNKISINFFSKFAKIPFRVNKNQFPSVLFSVCFFL